MQQEWNYVYAIYKVGNFSKAAEELHVTQPALSMAIRKIESSIGMALFDRSKRPLQLTEAGRIYVNAIEKMRSLEEDMDRQIQDIYDLTSGYLCIGGSHYINAYVLPDTLTRYSRAYPGIRIELVEASSARLSEMLDERAVDLTFSCNGELLAKFEKYPSFHDHILLAVSSSNPAMKDYQEYALSPAEIIEGRHLLPDCPALPAQGLKDLEFIILSPGNNLHDRATQIFQSAGVQPKIKIEIAQLATAYYLAASGFGATFVSDRMVVANGTNIPMTFYKIASQLTDRLFYALLPNREYTSRAVKSFIEFCTPHAS